MKKIIKQLKQKKVIATMLLLVILFVVLLPIDFSNFSGQTVYAGQNGSGGSGGTGAGGTGGSGGTGAGGTGGGNSEETNTKPGVIASLLARMLGTFFSWIMKGEGWIIVVLTRILMGFMSYNSFVTAYAVTVGWTLVRDVSNLFFVLILLIIAIATILRIEAYNFKRLLPKVVLMAILINFSRLICGVFIDFSQVVMMTFVAAFAKTVGAGGSNLIQLLKINEMINAASGQNGSAKLESDTSATNNISLTGLIVTCLLAIIMLLIAIMVILVMVAVIIMRMIMLWMLVVLSPLAYILAAFPQGQRYAQQWWQEFSKYVIVGPVLAFFLWLSFTVAGKGINDDTLGGGSSVADLSNPDTGLKGKQTQEATFDKNNSVFTGIGDINVFLSFVIGIGMLMASLMITQQMGVAGGALAGSAFNKIRSTALGALKAPGSLAWGGIKMGARGAGRLWDRSMAKYSTTGKFGSTLAGFLSPTTVKKAWEESRKEAEEEAFPVAVGKMQHNIDRLKPINKTGYDYEHIAAQRAVATRQRDVKEAARSELDLSRDFVDSVESGNELRAQAALRELVLNNQTDDLIAGYLGEDHSPETQMTIIYDMLKDKFGEKKTKDIFSDMADQAEAAGKHRWVDACTRELKMRSDGTPELDSKGRTKIEEHIPEDEEAGSEFGRRVGRTTVEKFGQGMEGKQTRGVIGWLKRMAGREQEGERVDAVTGKTKKASMVEADSRGISRLLAYPWTRLMGFLKTRGHGLQDRAKEVIGIDQEKDEHGQPTGNISINMGAMIDFIRHGLKSGSASEMLDKANLDPATLRMIQGYVNAAGNQLEDQLDPADHSRRAENLREQYRLMREFNLKDEKWNRKNEGLIAAGDLEWADLTADQQAAVANARFTKITNKRSTARKVGGLIKNISLQPTFGVTTTVGGPIDADAAMAVAYPQTMAATGVTEAQRQAAAAALRANRPSPKTETFDWGKHQQTEERIAQYQAMGLTEEDFYNDPETQQAVASGQLYNQTDTWRHRENLAKTQTDLDQVAWESSPLNLGKKDEAGNFVVPEGSSQLQQARLGLNFLDQQVADQFHVSGDQTAVVYTSETSEKKAEKDRVVELAAQRYEAQQHTKAQGYQSLLESALGKSAADASSTELEAAYAKIFDDLIKQGDNNADAAWARAAQMAEAEFRAGNSQGRVAEDKDEEGRVIGYHYKDKAVAKSQTGRALQEIIGERFSEQGITQRVDQLRDGLNRAETFALHNTAAFDSQIIAARHESGHAEIAKLNPTQIQEFIKTLSKQQHQEIDNMVKAGMTPEEAIEEFMAQLVGAGGMMGVAEVYQPGKKTQDWAKKYGVKLRGIIGRGVEPQPQTPLATQAISLKKLESIDIWSRRRKEWVDGARRRGKQVAWAAGLPIRFGLWTARGAGRAVRGAGRAGMAGVEGVVTGSAAVARTLKDARQMKLAQQREMRQRDLEEKAKAADEQRVAIMEGSKPKHASLMEDVSRTREANQAATTNEEGARSELAVAEREAAVKQQEIAQHNQAATNAAKNNEMGVAKGYQAAAQAAAEQLKQIEERITAVKQNVVSAAEDKQIAGDEYQAAIGKIKAEHEDLQRALSGLIPNLSLKQLVDLFNQAQAEIDDFNQAAQAAAANGQMQEASDLRYDAEQNQIWRDLIGQRIKEKGGSLPGQAIKEGPEVATPPAQEVAQGKAAPETASPQAKEAVQEAVQEAAAGTPEAQQAAAETLHSKVPPEEAVMAEGEAVAENAEELKGTTDPDKLLPILVGIANTLTLMEAGIEKLPQAIQPPNIGKDVADALAKARAGVSQDGRISETGRDDLARLLFKIWQAIGTQNTLRRQDRKQSRKRDEDKGEGEGELPNIDSRSGMPPTKK